MTLTHALELFAFHVRTIATEPPGSRFGLGIDAVYVKVEIRSASDEPNPTPSVWDQVYIDGVCHGNRAGGTNAYAKVCAPVFASLTHVVV